MVSENEAAVEETAQAETTTDNAEPWFSRLDDADLKGYAESKGWKSEAEAVRSYRNLEKLRGVPEDRLLKLPEDPKDMGAVWDRLGRPESADKYTAALPDEMRDALYDRMAGKAHAAGLTDAQWKVMQEEFAAGAQEVAGARKQDFDAKFDAWKGENPQAFQKVRHLMQTIGAGAEEVQAAMDGDAAAFYAVLAKVAGRMGEQPAAHGDAPSFTLSPEAARQKRDAMMGDEAFQKRLFSTDAKVREAAAAEIRPYHKIIAQSGANDPDLRAENDRLKAELRRRA